MNWLSILCLVCFASFCNADQDPEVNMDTIQIIEYYGYPAERHHVTTDDGYILEMHRIPYGKGQDPNKDRPVVILMHGMETSSVTWVFNQVDKSAGFMFADNNYDVWLGNVRGNIYSTAHVTLGTNSDAFWDFSWDEMVQYDLPAMIDYTLNYTKKSSLHYIGHSQGTLAMFSRLAVDQSFGKKIDSFFALAPVATLKHMEGLLSFLASIFSPSVKAFESIFGSKEFFPRNELMTSFEDIICGTQEGSELCENLMFLISGFGSNQLNETKIPVYTSHVPSGTSVRNMDHYVQAKQSGLLQKFDFGSDNFNHYGQSTPPIYDISLVNVPTYIYYGDDDWLADKMDIEDYILPNIPKQYLKEVVELASFNHLDFVIGLNAPSKIYIPMIKTIDALEKNKKY
uniref:Lipase n=1 Tax=Rhabditophanes sp. KR3021 TaxID=114890 RepID=A0AC35UGS0_9BILA